MASTYRRSMVVVDQTGGWSAGNNNIRTITPWSSWTWLHFQYDAGNATGTPTIALNAHSLGADGATYFTVAQDSGAVAWQLGPFGSLQFTEAFPLIWQRGGAGLMAGGHGSPGDQFRFVVVHGGTPGTTTRVRIELSGFEGT